MNWGGHAPPADKYNVSHLFTSLNETMDRLVDKVDTRFDGFRDDMEDVRDRLRPPSMVPSP